MEMAGTGETSICFWLGLVSQDAPKSATFHSTPRRAMSRSDFESSEKTRRAAQQDAARAALEALRAPERGEHARKPATWATGWQQTQEKRRTFIRY